MMQNIATSDKSTILHLGMLLARLKRLELGMYQVVLIFRLLIDICRLLQNPPSS